MSAVQLQLGDDGILVATMDLAGRPMNVVGDELMTGIAEATARLADANVKGLVLTSGKADFCAGGDLDRMSKWTTPEQPFEGSMAMKQVLRQLENRASVQLFSALSKDGVDEARAKVAGWLEMDTAPKAAVPGQAPG